MMQDTLTELLLDAIDAAEKGDTAKALPLLEEAMRVEVNAVVCSYLAYCTACEQGELANAVMLCRQVIRDEPHNPVHYLNLGRVYAHHGRRAAALKAFRAGLEIEPHPAIIAALDALGVRKRPPVPFLSRDNLINKYLGLLRHFLRIRRPDPAKMLSAIEDVT